jgi:Subtilase family/Secretion system C-terminal sorting domain
MKKRLQWVFALICALFAYQNSQAQKANSQPVRLLAGNVDLAEDTELTLLRQVSPNEIVNGRFVRLIQFHQLPMPAVKSDMAKLGIEILDYIPENAYIVSLPTTLNVNELQKLGIKNAYILRGGNKVAIDLVNNNFPAYAQKVVGKYDYAIRFYPHADETVAKDGLRRLGVEIIGLPDIPTGEIIVRGTRDDAWKMASLPYVRFVDFCQPPHTPEYYRSKGNHRSNLLDTEMPGGLKFDGAGFGIGVGDDGRVGPNIDFQGRLVDLTNDGTNLAANNHGDYTASCLGASGNRDPSIRGSATGANIISYAISGYPQVVQAPQNQTRYNAYVTNTSYAQVCNRYDGNSVSGDQAGWAYPKILHFFSAGNNGTADCIGVNAFGNITGGMKLAKNVMAIGSLNELDNLVNSSSRGPSFDGRIKPELCAVGDGVTAAGMNNTNLAAAGGTSFSAPHAAGGATQLYHAFASMNGGQIPDAALIKSVMMNTCDDLGNEGPDYRFGFGRLNVWRAFNVLKNKNFRQLSVTRTDSIKRIPLSIPAETKQVRVMVYWHDPAGTVNTTKALVNDLDVTLKVGAQTYQPWTLSTNVNFDSLNRPAVRGIDRVNNVEQITLEDPAGDAAEITINGFSLPSDSISFYVTWEFVKDEIKVVHPNGGEGFHAGHAETIRWDAFGNGTYNVDVSYDNGATWAAIRTNIPNVRHTSWTAPNTVATGKAKVRVTRTTGTVISDESDANFTIAPVPQNVKVEYVCADTTYISYSAVATAKTYQIHRLGAKYMDSLMRTDRLFVGVPVKGLSEEWLTVRAVLPDGGLGQRAVAIRKPIGVTACPAQGRDMIAVRLGQQLGTTYYNCQTTIPLSMWVRNFGFASVDAFNLSYQLNNNAPVSVSRTQVLAFNDSTLYNFGNIPMPAIGTHTLKVWVTTPSDANRSNDTLTFNFGVRGTFANLPLNENFEGANFPPTGFNVGVFPSNAFSWQKSPPVQGADATTTQAVMIDGRSNLLLGASDTLFTWLVDLKNVNNAKLSFDVSYAPFSTGKLSRLKVVTSTDCGQTFNNEIYNKLRFDLYTNGGALVSTAWTPTRANMWRRDTVDLAQFRNSVVAFGFVYNNTNDNRLFLDNINIGSLSTSVNTPLSIPMLAATPNPSETGNFDVMLRNFDTKSLEIKVLDAAGRLLLSKQKGELVGDLNEAIDLKGQPSGVYLLHIQTDARAYSLKLTKI